MKYLTKLRGRVVILNDVPEVSLQKIQAAQKKCETEGSLEERGRFPTGLVSQPDVLALQSVILTTGRPGNLNDDVMLNEEVLPILWTAAFKPFNREHTKYIIGTMFDAFAVNKETGEVVAGIEKFREEDTDEDREEEKEELLSVIGELPENLDIITNQVLWSLHFPQDVAEIKRKAMAGEIFVSMEVWFTDYDYLIGNRIVKRTPELAEILDSKLRINGGSGFFGLERVKRVPRNLTFGGNAAVETPANPDSFILNVMDRHDLMDSKQMEHEMERDEEKVGANNTRIKELVAQNTLFVLESLSDVGKDNEDHSCVSVSGRSGSRVDSEACGSELIKAEVSEVVYPSEEKIMDNDKVVELLEKNAVIQNDHDKIVATLAEVNKDLEELHAKNTELEAKLEETLALVKEKEDALAEKAEAFVKLEVDNADLVEKLDVTSAELAEIEEARKLESRKAILVELGLSDERIVKVLTKTNELDEEAFTVEVDDIKAFMSELTPIQEEIEETETETAKVVAEEVVEETPEVEEVEASEEELAEVLEEVEEEIVPVAEAVAAVAIGAEDNEDEAQALTSAMAKAMGINL